MRYLYLALLLCMSAAAYTQDTLCIPSLKVESMVQDIKKKDLLEQKLFISEQQVQSFLNMDSLYGELRLDFMATNRSQQESINSLVKINEGSSILMSGIKEELKDVRLNLYNDNVNLRKDNEVLRKKNNDKNKAIIALGTALVATITAVIAL